MARLVLITALLLALQCTMIQAQTTNFTFTTLRSPDKFLMVDDIQHTPSNSSFLFNSRAVGLLEKSCGRLLYKDKVKVADSASVASFQTAFTFRITGPVNYDYFQSGYLHGDGLAFTFLKNATLLGQDPGSTFCLLKESEDGFATNHVFAVEFDTFQNNWCNDTSDSHIGVNINSMRSTWSYNLCGGSVRNCSYLVHRSGGYFTAWVDYDSASQKLEVFFANGSLYRNIAKPGTPLIVAAPVALSEILDEEYVYVGFSASTGTRREVHQIQSWTFSTSGMVLEVVGGSSLGRQIRVIVGVSVGLAAALVILGLWIHRRRSSKPDKFNLVDQNLVPRMFTLRELRKATGGFSRSGLLGSGGYGSVYKGVLPSGALVAVKQMRHGSKHGVESFQAEAASLSQIRHRNLVQLRGWCSDEEQLFLVYDYMCNGSLDEWLFRRSESLPLTLRYSVLSGVAAALSYLHEECVQCVLHRDIKSSNVLLDASLNAYLGDFGLARLVDHQKMEKTTMMAGTLGYMAPEMPHTGRATKETDVYSFGVLILEVISGVRPLDTASIERGDGILVDRVWRAHQAGNILEIADSRLTTGNSDDERKALMNLLHLGLLCCNPNPEDRPSTRLVAQLLQSSETMEMSMPFVPTRKPHAEYSKRGFSQMLETRQDDDSNTTESCSLLAVEEIAEENYTPSPDFSSGDQPVNLQSSFVPSSELYSGR